MIWGFQLVRSRHKKSAEFLNVLNDQVIPSMDFFFPDGSGIFQEDNANIHRALVVKEWTMNENEESFSHMNWPPQSPKFTALKVFDVLEKTERMVRLSCHQ